MSEDPARGRRRRPRQARSRQTVAWVLEGAARVFLREGMDATTNAIAREAGVSVGTLYEYFADKHALLHALAEQHLELAEAGVNEAFAPAELAPEDRLRRLVEAMLASHRFPSEAVRLARDPTHAHRARALEEQVLAGLEQLVPTELSEESLPRARAAFGAVAQLPSLALRLHGEEVARGMVALHVQMGLVALGTGDPVVVDPEPMDPPLASLDSP